MKTFDELFEMALQFESIEKPNNPAQKEAMKYFYNLSFNIWLQQNKGWEYGNEKQYIELLTKENWKEYLANEIKQNIANRVQYEHEKQSWQPQQTETKTDKLKVPQIALIHVYEGIQITRENAGEIAAKHGYTAKNSGEGLFQDYTNYCSPANRKGKPTPCTPKKLKNKIELFESVVNHLSDNSKQRAIDEIMILKTILENEYQ